MKLGSLIPEVYILCVKLQDSRPPQANFFEKLYFLFQEYAFSLPEHYSHFGSPLIPKFLLPTPFNPKSPK